MLHCHLYLHSTPVTRGSEVFKQEKKGALISGDFKTTQRKKRPRYQSVIRSPRLEQDKLPDREQHKKDAFLKGRAGKRATGTDAFLTLPSQFRSFLQLPATLKD